jgi:hypothetical protein
VWPVPGGAAHHGTASRRRTTPQDQLNTPVHWARWTVRQQLTLRTSGAIIRHGAIIRSLLVKRKQEYHEACPPNVLTAVCRSGASQVGHCLHLSVERFGYGCTFWCVYVSSCFSLVLGGRSRRGTTELASGLPRGHKQQRGASCPHLPPTRRLKLSSKVTTYTYLAPFQGRVRARRGNDVRAERCPRVRRDQTALWSVLGLHIANFPMFSPIRETTHPPKNTVFALARPRDVLVQSSATRDLAHGPCAPPPTSRRAPRCAVHGWANTKGSSVGPSGLPHHLWR